MVRTELIQSLENNIRILSDFTKSIPIDRLHLTRGEGFWSIYQHIRHLADVQKVIHLRLEQFLKEEPQIIVPIQPDKDTDMMTDHTESPDRLLDAFSFWRTSQLDIIRAASDTVWAREITHPEYEKYSFTIMVRHALLHDSFHMHRIEELWLLHDEYLPVL